MSRILTTKERLIKLETQVTDLVNNIKSLTRVIWVAAGAMAAHAGIPLVQGVI